MKVKCLFFHKVDYELRFDLLVIYCNNCHEGYLIANLEFD